MEEICNKGRQNDAMVQDEIRRVQNVVVTSEMEWKQKKYEDIEINICFKKYKKIMKRKITKEEIQMSNKYMKKYNSLAL